ncbi:phosphatase PAP2 family protein [Anaeromyxobacter diazotrophicus]|uniref:phosphatase PAP2 family protein n=1 Tax=Anaeromyxobacter diazotrophicus TaxID=2590199 RepID=UPI001592A0AE|nr:phosphatase PAP2 family protein [Anaeromyxobacter diazotrophicus]
MLRAPVAAALVAAAFPAWPEEAPPLAVDVPVTAAVTGAGLALWGAMELAKGELTPSSCRWCTPPALDRRVRAAVVWPDRRAAALLSDVLEFALPASLAGADFFSAGRDLRRASEDVLVAMEAVALAAAATQLAKSAVARRRPATWATGVRTGPEDDRAFFSGHAATAFAAAAAFGTVARMRGYPAWPAVYAVGFGVAATVGYLRMAADEHWLTDVVASAAVGTALGMAVPLLLHRSPREGSWTLAPLAGGAAGVRWVLRL